MILNLEAVFTNGSIASYRVMKEEELTDNEHNTVIQRTEVASGSLEACQAAVRLMVLAETPKRKRYL